LCAAESRQESGRAGQRENCERVKRSGTRVTRCCAEKLKAELKDIFWILKVDFNNIDSLVPLPEK
jgi:hypothetical protein